MSETVLIAEHVVVQLPAGVRAMVVHDATACTGRECVIHNPTEHPMRRFPLHWRADRAIFERLCPHGVGHPDPDQQAYWREQAARDVNAWDVAPDDEFGIAVHRRSPEEHVTAQMTHDCDGCCLFGA